MEECENYFGQARVQPWLLQMEKPRPSRSAPQTDGGQPPPPHRQPGRPGQHPRRRFYRRYRVTRLNSPDDAARRQSKKRPAVRCTGPVDPEDAARQRCLGHHLARSSPVGSGSRLGQAGSQRTPTRVTSADKDTATGPRNICNITAGSYPVGSGSRLGQAGSQRTPTRVTSAETKGLTRAET